MAYMELRNDIKAIEEYKKVIAKNESAGTNILKDEAEYYLALAFLHNKDYDHALEMMNKIHNDPNHIYNEKITAKLINEVKSLR